MESQSSSVCTPRAVLGVLVLAAALGPLRTVASAAPLQVKAAVEKKQVFVAEPFLLQIQIEGSDSPEKPDVSGITDFSVQELGGQQNTSQSVTIVNGKVNQVVRRGYVFSYRLTPKRKGQLRIPAINVSVEGKSMSTQPISILVTPPTESEDFELRLSLSESRVYLGQPVTLTVTWYVGRDVRTFSFHVPVFDDSRFEVAGTDPAIDPKHRDRYVSIPLGKGQVIGEKSRGKLDGREYLTVSFRRVLIPKQAGRVTLPQASVTCQAMKGARRNRGRSILDDFFGEDFFSMGRRAFYEMAASSSNQPVLDVLELPSSGRPPDFSGLVGNYKISAQASPTDVSVGDPITLTMKVSGPAYLDNVELPPLAAQPSLARDFKVPQERAPGTVSGRVKTFTQTIRARHAEVERIPPIELSYFNPETGRYDRTRTDPIPLNVKAAKIVTARDAEGLSAGGAPQSELETLEGGIAHNYEDFDALENQLHSPTAWLRSPVWVIVIFLPPLAYLGLFAFTFVARRRGADPVLRRARQAYRVLSKQLKAVETIPADEAAEQDSALLEALRRYLGDRLGLPAAALTFADVEKELAERNVPRKTIDDLKAIFERCEAGRYAGGALSDQTASETAQRMMEAAGDLEGALKRS